jgi:hypothetical protein
VKKIAVAALIAAYFVIHAVRRASASNQADQANKPATPDQQPAPTDVND